MAGTYPLTWNKDENKLYETGVKNVVLYLKDKVVETEGATKGFPYALGVAWEGVTSISESPSGAEATALYANDVKYLNLISNEEFAASLEAYTYPDEFAECDGSAELVAGVTIGQQPRKQFGLCYTTTLGNAAEGNEHGEILHLVYNCLAAPSEKAYATINDSPEAITFSWEISTTPEEVTGHRPTAIIKVNSTKVDKTKFAALKDVLYGKGNVAPRLPLPNEVKTILEGAGA